MLENLFFEGLQFVTPHELELQSQEDQVRPKLDLEGRLKEYKPLDFRSWLKLYLLRSLKLVAFAAVLFLLSSLPKVGVLVMPMTQFYYSSKIMGFPLALFFSVVAYLLKFFFNSSIPFWLTSSNLTRELLEPYFGRLHDICKSQNQNPKHREAELRKRYFLLFFSFGLVINVLLFTFPLLSPLVFLLSQVMVAHLFGHFFESGIFSSSIQLPTFVLTPRPTLILFILTAAIRGMKMKM
eukprot:TRINITY_DN7348_c0_g1_i1.p1 TRINITY_DN7348_c0_g1~~TRINITY_DN7348_c0_g1_i1.p1  ORF type:complete len:238 (-),score=35.27 TRINITY_DN7348_c0_g1_i1:154-867(-)